MLTRLTEHRYTSHFDNRAVRRLADPGTLSDSQTQGSVARVTTFMVYCASPISCVAVLALPCRSHSFHSGGQTHFPRARGVSERGEGIKIAPIKGRAVLFRNVRNGTGVEDECSLHEACPVLAGEKVVMTLWVTNVSRK